MQTLWFLAAGWFLLALFIGETELLGLLPPIAPQLIAVFATIVLIASYSFSRSFRDRVNSWSLKNLVAVHLTRFIGIYLLYLSSRGELDSRFAIAAGWGHMAVAAGALALLLLRLPRWTFLAWNIAGFMHILFALARAASLRLTDPDALDEFTQLPLSFFPTLIVPLIIASHLVIFFRFLGNSVPLPRRETPEILSYP